MRYLSVARVGIVVVSFVAAALIRMTNFQYVFVGDSVIFPEFDPYYQIWRVFQTLRDYPHVPFFDTAMNFPHGATVIWPPGVSFFVATICKLFGLGAGDVRGVETISAMIMPFIGAITVIPVYFLGKRFFGQWIGALACALFIFIPTHIWYSRIGFVDNHAFVTLAQAVMFLVFMMALDVHERGITWRRLLMWELCAAAAMIAGFLVWNGFIFYIAVLDLFLLTLLYKERENKDSATWKLVVVSHTLAAAAIAYFAASITARSGAPFSPITLSWFHVVAVGAFAMIGAAEGIRRSNFLSSLSAKTRVGVILSPLTIVAALIIYKIPALALGFQWITASDKFMSSVTESGSSLITGGVWDFYQPQAWMTRFYLVIPAILALLGWREWKDGFKNRDKMFLLLWGTILFAMSVTQRRFAETFAPTQAILVSWFLFEMYRWIVDFFTQAEKQPAKGKGAKAVAIPKAPPYYLKLVAAGVCVAVTIFGYYITFDHYFQTLLVEANYNRQVYADLKKFGVALAKTDGAIPMGEHRRFGCVNPWDFGHKIMYITGMGVVSNNFGLHIGEDSFGDWIKFFMETDENSAAAMLDKRNIRFAVVDFDVSSPEYFVSYLDKNPADYFETVPTPTGSARMIKPALLPTMYFRMGSSNAGSSGEVKYPTGDAATVPPLDHFRLVQDMNPARQAPRAFRIFERVKGAHVILTTTPGAEIDIAYSFTAPYGKTRSYKKKVTANGDGLAETWLPYSSERPDYGHTNPYYITSHGAQKELRVTEKDVTEGNEIRVELVK